MALSMVIRRWCQADQLMAASRRDHPLMPLVSLRWRPFWAENRVWLGWSKAARASSRQAQALRPLCCAVACTGCQGFEGANARGYFGEAT